jgi:hypothetical protein
VGVAGLIVSLAALLIGGPAQPSGEGTHVADCERGPVTDGPGPPGWRQKSISAGPLGVFKRPLRQMSETRNGQLTAKMPVLVDGSTPVTLSVPPGQRRRVFLYYGRLRDRDGNPTTTIGRAPGFSEVLFEPCLDRPRTAWPGGIRVIGRKRVSLTVTVEGRPDPIPLPLGRPYRSPTA